jgi:hypothetical protein
MDIFLILTFLLAELFLIVDLLQTRYIASNPQKFRELNVVLGEHPSVSAVNLYFAAWLVGMAVLAYLGTTMIWPVLALAGVAVFEAGCTYRNYKLGIKFA